jgi:hypothetical protein
MLALTLALVLSTAPPVLQSDVESHNAQDARADCLKRAMNQAMDRIITPLEQKDTASFNR